jgi:hypothetical protein
MRERDPVGGDSDEEAAWRDLVARFDGPAAGEQGTAPWPERENLRISLNGEHAPGLPDHAPAERGPGDAGENRTAGEPPESPAGSAPEGSTGHGHPGRTGPADDEHFVPPPAPPLPELGPVVKGAWLALFGGPAYLLVATGAGWTVPGWAAFCAMAAFVGGFVVLVLQLGSDRRDNGSDDDDGAVV